MHKQIFWYPKGFCALFYTRSVKKAYFNHGKIECSCIGFCGVTFFSWRSKCFDYWWCSRALRKLQS